MEIPPAPTLVFWYEMGVDVKKFKKEIKKFQKLIRQTKAREIFRKEVRDLLRNG